MLKVFLIMFAIGMCLGILLMIANKVFAVKQDGRFEKALSMLPGYNCGACGFPGCSGMVAALLSGDSGTLQCKPCKPEQRKAIVEYLNTEPGPDGKTLNIKSI
ncbi:MAG: (Fe-S)-binding protein [Erysipelotrichaceae bacterium]|nr:(Fe-S)-binding protein [Erysipelotrichaceae bacterium]